MPQLRIYHQGRYMYYQPKKAVHFLPPLTTPSITSRAVSSVGSALSRDDEDRMRQRRVKREIAYKRMVEFVGRSLTKENVDDLRFLAKEHIHPSYQLDRVMDGRGFLKLLQRQKLLAENSLQFLQTLLCYSPRPDLYEVVFRFRYKTQDGFRRQGVDIDEKYRLSQDDVRLRLNRDMNAFRQSLKSNSRFQSVNIPEAQMQMEELAKRLDRNRLNYGRLNPSDSDVTPLEHTCAERYRVNRLSAGSVLPTIQEKPQQKSVITKSDSSGCKRDPLRFLEVEGQTMKTSADDSLDTSTKQPVVKSKIKKLRQRIGIETAGLTGRKSVSGRLYNNMNRTALKKKDLPKPKVFKRKPRFSRPDRAALVEMEDRFAIMTVVTANNPIDQPT